MTTLHACPRNVLAVLVAVLGVLLIAASLPAVGAAAVILRAVAFTVAVVTTVICILAFAISPRFRRWLAAKLDTQPAYMGLRLRDGVSLDDRHGWARRNRDEFAIGVDDLAQRALGPVERVELPALERYVVRGEPVATLRHGARALCLRAPLSGVVRRLNQCVLSEPDRINSDPYGGGWLLALKPVHLYELDRLHRGSPARSWFCGEVDRFLRTVSPAHSTVMADGGTIVQDLHEALDDRTWERVRHEFFEVDPREVGS